MRTPRPRPCASCPYRRDVPSGIWEESEYVKLPDYDGETFEQNPAAFLCHQNDGHVCSGWLGHRDPYDLLAVRLGVLCGHLDESCLGYTTGVPLFSSGKEAARHGMRDIDSPSIPARRVVDKIEKKRSITQE